MSRPMATRLKRWPPAFSTAPIPLSPSRRAAETWPPCRPCARLPVRAGRFACKESVSGGAAEAGAGFFAGDDPGELAFEAVHLGLHARTVKFDLLARKI